ncbi:MAG: ABC transporter ATP-binding protein [Desulfurococcaceae archaeon]
MSVAVELRGIYKKYNNVVALRGISLRVSEGEIYGLVGPNGAGKTTLLRIIAGLVKPDQGNVYVHGLDPYSDYAAVRNMIGYLPEDANTYDLLTGYEHIFLYSMLYNLTKEGVEYGVKIAGLGERVNDLTKNYSKGMKRRLLLALVLMRKPRVALLDEPTAGLDVHASFRVRKAIKEYVIENKASAILSSHNMLEIQDLCDKVGLVHEGRIIAEGSPWQLIKQHNARNLEEVFIKLTGD